MPMKPDKFIAVTSDKGIQKVTLEKVAELDREDKLEVVYGLKNTDIIKRIMIERLANPRKKFVMKTFAERYRVPLKVIRQWMDSPEVDKRVRARVDALKGEGVMLAQIMKKMATQAVDGHFKQQRLIFEMSGLYQPGMKIEHDVATIESKFKELEKQRNEQRQLTDGE